MKKVVVNEEYLRTLYSTLTILNSRRSESDEMRDKYLYTLISIKHHLRYGNIREIISV